MEIVYVLYLIFNIYVVYDYRTMKKYFDWNRKFKVKQSKFENAANFWKIQNSQKEKCNLCTMLDICIYF